jgi:hypothetical protein
VALINGGLKESEIPDPEYFIISIHLELQSKPVIWQEMAEKDVLTAKLPSLITNSCTSPPSLFRQTPGRWR